jgi:Polyketide cyclase / dehydrase and lipid transport
MILNILIALAVIFIVLIVIVALQAPDFRYTRSIIISAPASTVFAQVNDFHNWKAWSPWVKYDPAAKNFFDGPSAGKGAIFKWSGNNRIGEGINTIIESRQSELIKIKIEFLRPFKATNTAEFTFKTENNQTVVSWSMFGKNNFMSKAMGLIMNCEKMIGGQFEEGLANLKSVAEKAPKA